MKRILIASLLLSTVQLAAQTTATHKTGVTFSVAQASGEVSARRLFGRQWAALGVLGYSHGTAYAYAPASPFYPNDITTWSAGLAARRYFSPAPLRPFAELGAGVRRTDFAPCNHFNNPYGTAVGGVEYNVAPRVSIEGSAGLNYSSSSQRCNSGGIEYRLDSHSFSTFRTALSITFYF